MCFSSILFCVFRIVTSGSSTPYPYPYPTLCDRFRAVFSNIFLIISKFYKKTRQSHILRLPRYNQCVIFSHQHLALYHLQTLSYHIQAREHRHYIPSYDLNILYCRTGHICKLLRHPEYQISRFHFQVLQS